MADSLGTIEEPVRAPLKMNAFEFARQSNSQLNPMFPYAHPGAIVPCVACFESAGTGASIGYFIHENSVDEIALTWGSNGRTRTGDVVVGPRRHGVGGASHDAFFALIAITQRQLEAGDQREVVGFQCEACSADLFSYEYGQDLGSENQIGGLPTIVGSEAAAVAFNADEQKRTCKKCGHVNPPFPLPIWGWGAYVRNTRVAENALRSLAEKAQ